MARIRVQEADFDIGAEFARLTAGRTDIGGIGCFVGTVRCNPGERVAAMTLEHYPAMTERAIARIAEEAERRWSLLGCTVIHRVGRLTAGENIVLVLAASSHRQAALEVAAGHAQHFLEQRLKQAQHLTEIMDRPPLVVSPYDAELFGQHFYQFAEVNALFCGVEKYRFRLIALIFHIGYFHLQSHIGSDFAGAHHGFLLGVLGFFPFVHIGRFCLAVYFFHGRIIRFHISAAELGSFSSLEFLLQSPRTFPTGTGMASLQDTPLPTCLLKL